MLTRLPSKSNKPRMVYERRFWRFDLDIARHINRQCLTLGLTVNWNFRPAIELEFMFWTICIEYIPIKR